ncbi:MAG: major capsid protein [Pseudomonadota bacterium]|nr:major capsid protein [Pseudomonadota bacterium]
MNKLFKSVMQTVRQAAMVALPLGMVAARADTGPDTSAITTAVASIAVIGGAVFALKVGLKAWSWLRAAL